MRALPRAAQPSRTESRYSIFLNDQYSLDRLGPPRPEEAGRLDAGVVGPVERTEAPDPATLIIHTRWPDLLVPARLASCAGAMVPWDRVGLCAALGAPAEPRHLVPEQFDILTVLVDYHAVFADLLDRA